MPYIKPDRRAVVDTLGDAQTPGELNYLLTQAAIDYFLSRPAGSGYQAINDVIGAFEGAKLEFYRRVAVPYEDAKIKENGDVYQ